MEEQQNEQQSKFLYNNINELVSEWQLSQKECSLWEYLGISESAFKVWMSKCRAGVFEN